MILKNPDDFVLKPQDEGGAHNYYGQTILDIFSKVTYESLKNYILMKKIKGISDYAFVLKEDSIQLNQILSELGVYSYLIHDDH